MALVTVTDLREYMSGMSFSAAQMHTAQMVLDGTQQALELYLNRPVQPVQVRERRRSDAMGDLMLSVSPVYQVFSIGVLGESMSEVASVETTPMAEEEIDRVWDAMPNTRYTVPGGIFVGRSYTWYVVDYVGGYNGYVDDALKLSILEVASRTMTVNHDDVLTIKDDIAREPASSTNLVKGWRPEELQMFDRLRRRTVYR